MAKKLARRHVSTQNPDVTENADVLSQIEAALLEYGLVGDIAFDPPLSPE
jgi:hypothetical protein